VPLTNLRRGRDGYVCDGDEPAVGISSEICEGAKIFWLADMVGAVSAPTCRLSPQRSHGSPRRAARCASATPASRFSFECYNLPRPTINLTARAGEMTTPSPKDVTQLLVAWGGGDQAALDELIPLVHEELRRLASRYMRREGPGHTLQTSALVNEAYLRLVNQKRVQWQNRAHFFGVAAQLMRRILVDHARRHASAKRGGGAQRMTLSECEASIVLEQAVEVIALDEALKRLAVMDRRKSEIVEMKFFGGLTTDEVAEVLKVTPRTVELEWRKAKAWLHRTIREGEADEA
jgi:RNA polymerase sigma-70 factor (ECF subfamily)